jgi:hypothetical protein
MFFPAIGLQACLILLGVFCWPVHLSPILFTNPDHVGILSIFPSPSAVISSPLAAPPSWVLASQQKSQVIFHAISADHQPPRHLSLFLQVSEVLCLPTRTF